MFRRFHPAIVTAICIILAVFSFTSCPITIPDPWPTDFDDLFSFTQTDPEDDVLLEVFGDPFSPYAITYDPIDVTDVSLGMVLDDQQVPEDDYLYIRVENVDSRPTESQDVPDTWPAYADKIIVEHEHQVGFDVDSTPATNEVTFKMSFVYGGTNSVDGSYLLPSSIQGDLSGELCVWCGSGHNYFVVRYDISDLKKYIGSGTSITVNYYGSIGCVDSGGNELGTYYAYDEITIPASWDVPW